jgi:crossover junction endodeoxyribonuclease RuvC
MARMNVRMMWKAKLEGRAVPSAASPAASAAGFSLSRPAYIGKILGIDPSLRGTGLALVEFIAGQARPVLLHSETVRVPARLTQAEALAQIHQAVARIVAGAQVRHVALEQLIYVQNIRTAQILGAARGAAVSAVAIEGLEIFEYPPLRVKQAVVGVGRASKEQMARTVMAHFGHFATMDFDEADAAAVALCHAFTARF